MILDEVPMKSEAEIKEVIKVIEAMQKDKRPKGKPATGQLALFQLGLEAQLETLKWILLDA
jgi:hypothetical protein